MNEPTTLGEKMEKSILCGVIPFTVLGIEDMLFGSVKEMKRTTLK